MVTHWPGAPPENEAIWLDSVELCGGFWLRVGERIEVRNEGGELRVAWARR